VLRAGAGCAVTGARSVPTNTAGPVERAGFTDRLVIGMPTRWTSVSVRPMAIPANPAGLVGDVAPMITETNTKVRRISLSSAAIKP